MKMNVKNLIVKKMSKEKKKTIIVFEADSNKSEKKSVES
jgi:hypothetical protein